MAYVPDEAIKRFSELTTGERLLYIQLCLYRCGDKGDKNYGLAFPSREKLALEMDLAVGHISRLQSGLIAKKWVKKQGWKTLMIVGFEEPEKSQKGDKLNSHKKVTSHIPPVEKSQFSQSHIRNIEPEEPKKREEGTAQPVKLFEEYIEKAKKSQPENQKLRCYSVNIFDAEQIQLQVQYIELFEDVLKHWLGNRYQMCHLGNILQFYKEKEPQWLKEHPPKLDKANVLENTGSTLFGVVKFPPGYKERVN